MDNSADSELFRTPDIQVNQTRAHARAVLELRILPDNVPSSDLPDSTRVGKGQIVSQKEIRGREKRGQMLEGQEASQPFHEAQTNLQSSPCSFSG